MDYETYNFLGDEIDSPIIIEKLEQKTDYDFSKPHRHNYNELFFFIKGNGEHMIDFKKHNIKDFSVHIVSPNKIHKVIRGNESYGFVILFRNEFVKKYNSELDLFFLMECEKINLNKKKFKEQLSYLKKIVAEIKNNNPLKYEVINAYLSLILINLKQFTQIKNNCQKCNLSKNIFYKEFHNILEQNFKTNRIVKSYSEKLHVNTSVLNKKLVKITGKTASKLIKDRVLLEAKRLLLDVSLSIKEIAFLLHFTDASHFSNFFYRETSLNPSEFRQKIKIYNKK